MSDHLEPAEALWDARYLERSQIWSGRVNAVVAELVEPLDPATALDVGCGEGGDVVWLAERGWRATGVDVSGVAIERARRAAAERELQSRAQFERRDLETAGELDGEYDLVLSSYLHSPGHLDRSSILRSAARVVRPGGTLLVVGHGAPPPWADANAHAHAHRLPSVSETLAELSLEGAEWMLELADERPREVVGPDGTPAELLDVVVLARRR